MNMASLALDQGNSHFESRTPLASLSTAEDASRRLHFWLTCGILAVFFFFIAHNLTVSRLPDYAHYDDSVISVAVGTNFIRRIAFFAFGGLGLFLAFVSSRQPWRFSPALALPMIGYLLWCCASVLWSIDPSTCLKRVVTLICFNLCAFGIGRRFTMRELAWMMFVIMGGYFALGLVMELSLGTFRPWSSGHRFAGTLHPNSQASHLTMFCLAAFCLGLAEPRHRGKLYLLVAVGLGFVLLTRSRTNAAAAVVALGFIWMLRSSLKAKLNVAFVSVGLISLGLLLLVLQGVDPLTELLQAAMLGRKDDVQTLSGRNLIWPICWSYIQQKPWLGYGYGSFWNTARIDEFLEELQFSLFEAHNGYLELRLGTGMIGLLLYVTGMVTGLIASARACLISRESSFALLFGVMIFAFIFSNSESGMMGINLVTLLMTSLMFHLAFCPAPTASGSDQPTEIAVLEPLRASK